MINIVDMIFEQEKLVRRTDIVFDGYGEHGMSRSKLVVRNQKQSLTQGENNV